MRFCDSAPSRKAVIWCLGLIVVAISQAHCGSKCGGFVPCAPDALLAASMLQLSFADQSVGTVSSPQTVKWVPQNSRVRSPLGCARPLHLRMKSHHRYNTTRCPEEKYCLSSAPTAKDPR